MPFSKRLALSSLVTIGIVFVLVSSSVASLTAYGYGTNYNTQNQAAHIGWRVSWAIKTGPESTPLPLYNGTQLIDYINLESMQIVGGCTLNGITAENNTGMSGKCRIAAIVIASSVITNESYGISVCSVTFALGPSLPNASLHDYGDPMPYAWAAVPNPTLPYPSELYEFYGIPVSDFRVSSSTLLHPQGHNTFLCSNFLFEGYSADLFVPAQLGSFNFTGTPGLFGTFEFYQAKVRSFY